MTIKTKLTALLAIGFAAWQVNLTDSNRQMIGCFLRPSPCREADSARTLLYVMAGASALGILLRKGE